MRKLVVIQPAAAVLLFNRLIMCGTTILGAVFKLAMMFFMTLILVVTTLRPSDTWRLDFRREYERQEPQKYE